MAERALESQDAFTYAKAYYSMERAKLDAAETKADLHRIVLALIEKYKIDPKTEHVDINTGMILPIADESAKTDASK